MKNLKNITSLELIRFHKIFNEIYKVILLEKQKEEHNQRKNNMKIKISYESKNLYKTLMDLEIPVIEFVDYKEGVLAGIDCWIWRGNFNKKGKPTYTLYNPTGKICLDVIKHLFQEAKGRQQLSCCKLIQLCGVLNCVRPEHWKEVKY